MKWLIKPYSKMSFNKADKIVDYMISRGRRVERNAFVIVSSMFRVLQNAIQLQFDFKPVAYS